MDPFTGCFVPDSTFASLKGFVANAALARFVIRPTVLGLDSSIPMLSAIAVVFIHMHLLKTVSDL
jgi:hypothetical protein